MTIYYTFTFGLLVAEMAAFGILIVPLPPRWRRAVQKFVSVSPTMARAIHGLKIVFCFIAVLFVDALQRLQRIENENEEDRGNYGYESNLKAKRFYAQRNLYLTGFTLFLSLILERTSSLIAKVLQHEEETEKWKKEGASANKDQARLEEIKVSYEQQIEDLSTQIAELKHIKDDIAQLKEKAALASKDYDDLSNECNKLKSS